MKKVFTIILILLFGAVTLVGLIIGGWKLKKHMEYQEMLTIVKSEEAKEVYTARLRQIDSDAFTDKGVIQSYEVDYDSVRRNPMGGIIVALYVNNDKNYDVSVFIHKDSKTGKLENGGGSNPPLEKLKKKE